MKLFYRISTRSHKDALHLVVPGGFQILRRVADHDALRGWQRSSRHLFPALFGDRRQIGPIP